MQMGMCMLGTGRKIRLTVMESTVILTERGMKDIGKKIDKMGKEQRLGLMGQSTKVIMSWERSMGKGLLTGQMGQHTQGSSLITT